MHKCNPPEKVLTVKLLQYKLELMLEWYQGFISSPHTAWDRLSRVRQRNFGSSVNEDTQANKLSLYDDSAVKDGETLRFFEFLE